MKSKRMAEWKKNKTDTKKVEQKKITVNRQRQRKAERRRGCERRYGTSRNEGTRGGGQRGRGKEGGFMVMPVLGIMQVHCSLTTLRQTPLAPDGQHQHLFQPDLYPGPRR